MKIPRRKRSGIVILEPSGKITIGSGDIALRDAVEAALDAGELSILIDFKKAKMLDSSGMAELVAAKKKTQDKGGDVKLLYLPSSIRDVLSMTRIVTVFDVFDNEDEAIASFKQTQGS